MIQKNCPKKNSNLLAKEIKDSALAWSIASASVEEIDELIEAIEVRYCA